MLGKQVRVGLSLSLATALREQGPCSECFMVGKAHMEEEPPCTNKAAVNTRNLEGTGKVARVTYHEALVDKEEEKVPFLATLFGEDNGVGEQLMISRQELHMVELRDRECAGVQEEYPQVTEGDNCPPEESVLTR